MAITVMAVFEGGVLKPVQPLPLEEGETVQVTVSPCGPVAVLSGLPPMTPEVEEYTRRIRAARSLEEMFAIMETAPPDPNVPEDYDLLKALNENRKATGERLLYPEVDGEISL